MADVKLEHMQIAPVMWFDGALREVNATHVHPFTHALHYGSGVFEGIRAYATARGPGIFRLREHMERFVRSAQTYRLDLRYDAGTLCDAAVETLRASGLDSAYIRPLAYFGEKTMSLAPAFHCATHVMIALRALGNYFGAGQENGIRATISPWRKFSSRALPSTVKGCGHYANSVLAMQDALERGFDEAILLNDRGEVAEGTGENVFVVKDGILTTNDASADILPGITRDSVIALAADLGIEVRISPLKVEALLGADEIFFTGTAVEVTPLTAIDEHAMPAHKPVSTRLREAYHRATAGQDPLHPQWVTYALPAAERASAVA